MQNPFMTTNEVASELGKTYNQVHHAINRKKVIEPIEIGTGKSKLKIIPRQELPKLEAYFHDRNPNYANRRKKK